jgi:hypothetical protein
LSIARSEGATGLPPGAPWDLDSEVSIETAFCDWGEAGNIAYLPRGEIRINQFEEAG